MRIKKKIIGVRVILDEIGEITSLTRFYLRGNLVDSLPEALGKIKSLSCLDVSLQGNFFIDGINTDVRSLKHISPALYSIPSLKWDNLSGNAGLILTKEEIQKKLPVNCALAYHSKFKQG